MSGLVVINLYEIKLLMMSVDIWRSWQKSEAKGLAVYPDCGP
jgi:hypothetical protein